MLFSNEINSICEFVAGRHKKTRTMNNLRTTVILTFQNELRFTIAFKLPVFAMAEINSSASFSSCWNPIRVFRISGWCVKCYNNSTLKNDFIKKGRMKWRRRGKKWCRIGCLCLCFRDRFSGFFIVLVRKYATFYNTSGVDFCFSFLPSLCHHSSPISYTNMRSACDSSACHWKKGETKLCFRAIGVRFPLLLQDLLFVCQEEIVFGEFLA